MQAKHAVSINKIILFVVFITASIITSLFVYRSTHSIEPMHSDNSLLFSAGRDIKAFDLVAADGTAFTAKNFLGHWTLMFFGFTHCATVCPTTLGMLSKAYVDLHKNHPDLQIVLVSLDPQRDDIKTLANYTKRFHRDFIGVSGKTQELRKLQSQLGIYSERRDMTNQGSGGYQIQHSSSILLINPQGKWVGMFKYGMTPSAFTQTVNADLKQLARK